MIKLSKSLEDYIEAIYIIKTEKEVVRLKDLSKKLNVKLPSANQAIKKLANKGLVIYEKYDFIRLTKDGEKIGKSIYKRHTILFKFLNGILGVNKKTASREACLIEHDLSPSTMNKLMKFVERMEKLNK